MKQSPKNIWFISKYCRLPSEELNYVDVFQLKGSYPARAFSILRYLVREGHDCTLFVARHGYKIFNTKKIPSQEIKYIHGVRVVILNVIPYVKVQSISRILGWIQFEFKLLLFKVKQLPKPDCIIASSLSIFSILNGFIFRHRFKSKLIFEVRDIWPLVLIENGGFSRFNPFVYFLGFIEWLGYKYSDKIVATMPNLDEHVESILGYPKKVECIPMGISEELLEESSIETPEYIAKSMPKDKFIVTYVGSIGVDNALDSFFRTIRMLKNNQEIVFKVFGEGDLLTHYQSVCSDLENVSFEGYIPNTMVQSALKKSSILYFATHPTIVLKYGQSLNKIIDYMYSGRPIVASHSGYQSMINEAECGFFVPANDDQRLYDEIIRLSKISKDELTIIGEKGSSWLHSNRRYKTLALNYEKIINDLFSQDFTQ